MVSAFPVLRVTGPPGLTIFRPSRLKSAPSAGLFAVVTIEVHCAMSAVPGTTSQLAAKFSAELLFCLVRVAARAVGRDSASNANTLENAHAAPPLGPKGFFKNEHCSR